MSDEVETTEEQVLKRHRQEKKDLQAKIQQLKKTAPKGKKKKEVVEQIALLEKELDDKHNKELSELNLPINTQPPQEIYTNNIDDEQNVQDEENGQDATRVSRAQKRRNKKAAEDKEREKRITEQEEKNKQGPRVLELNSIKENLKALGLDLYNIPADGNCLYCAINHQLEVTGRETSTVTKLRRATADFMREHKEDFIPFMYNDDDGMVDEKQFEDYCKSVASTKVWGGQLELRALSNILECPIKIIQSTGQPTIQGENFTGPELVLTYHRHLYRLGEHYNSTVTAQETEEEKI